MSDLFLNLFNRAMAAGWLVLAVLVLRVVLKKAPKWVNCLLWGLVGLRLVWPVSIESVLSLIPSAQVLSPETLYDPTPELHTGIEFVNTAVNQSFTPAMTPAQLTSVNPLQIWTWLAGWVWLLGVLVLLGYALVSWLRLRKRVAASMEENGLWRCDDIDSPFILGVFRPKIYVPSDLGGEDLRYVAAHEQAHLARRDHWWKPLGYGLLTAFWFHPLLWAAYVLLCRDIELACDEKVVRELDGDCKKAYSQALVDCAVSRRAVAACPVAFGEVGVKQRVKSVLHYKKPAFWVVIVAVVLCIVAAVCFLTDPVVFRPDFEREDIALVQTTDLRLNSGKLAGELNEAQIDELWSRLRDLKGTEKNDAYGGFTPFYSMSIQLTDGQWIRIQGYALDGSKVDLVYGDDVYQINDTDFQAYLDRICAGGDRAAATAGDAQAIEVPDALADGSVYISAECLFMNPLSSTLSNGDTGYYYYIEGKDFVLVRRRTMTEGRIRKVNWQWQQWPFTDEAWAEQFWLEPVDVSGYAERLYLPLNDETYLLSMDGQLWLVDDHGDSKTGIWSIHTLERVDSVETARWAYMEGSGQPLTIAFDLEFDEVQLTCTGGQLYGAYENVNDEVLHYYGDQILYWTAGTESNDPAEIEFTAYRDGAVIFSGGLEVALDEENVPWFDSGYLEGPEQPQVQFGEAHASVRFYDG